MPSSHRPLHLPQRFLSKIRFDNATPAPTGGWVRSRSSPQTVAATSPPVTRGTRKASPRSAKACFTAARFSITGDTLSLDLPVPPSINRQYATVNGRRVLSAEGRGYKRMVGQLLMTGAASSPRWHGFLRKAQSRYLSLTIYFYFPTLLRRDIDGGLKITQDALCDAMSINDNRVVDIHLHKTFDRDHPRLECTLTPTDHPSPPSPPPRTPSAHRSRQPGRRPGRPGRV